MSAPSSDKAAIRQVIRALRKAGYVITGGHDGEDYFKVDPDVSEDTLIDDFLTVCDESTLHVMTTQGIESFVWFVLGNDPEEVVADHGTSLSEVLDPLTEGWWE